MKRFYNKSRCHAARITDFCISGDYEMTVDVEGGPLRPALKIHGGWNLIKYEEFPKQRQQMVEYRANDLWLVERYDISDDEIKYNVVEGAVFRENFYADDEGYPLVECHSFERARHEPGVVDKINEANRDWFRKAHSR